MSKSTHHSDGVAVYLFGKANASSVLLKLPVVVNWNGRHEFVSTHHVQPMDIAAEWVHLDRRYPTEFYLIRFRGNNHQKHRPISLLPLSIVAITVRNDLAPASLIGSIMDAVIHAPAS